MYRAMRNDEGRRGHTWAHRVAKLLKASRKPLEMADLLTQFGFKPQMAPMLHTILRRMQNYGFVSIGEARHRVTVGRPRLNFQLTESGRKWIVWQKAWMKAWMKEK